MSKQYISSNSPIIGYKGFDSDFTCRKFQYEVGKVYDHTGKVELCAEGFHFCELPVEITNYYPADDNNRFAIVEAWGITDRSLYKSAAQHLRVVRECSFEEIVYHFVERTKNGQWFHFEMCVAHIVRGKLHREDGLPSIIRTDGSKEWWADGKLHRDNDLPAVEWYDGRKEWWTNGARHRCNDLPAIETSDGHKEWWFGGQRHRDNDLPAVEWSNNGAKEWWVNGQRHREGGMPAVEYPNGTKEYWVNGIQDTMVGRVTISVSRFCEIR